MERRNFLSGLTSTSLLLSGRFGFSLSAAAPSASSQAPGDPWQGQSRAMEQAFKQSDAFLSSQAQANELRGSILVGIDGKIVFQKGYGFADQEWKVENTPTTKFRIASLTKQFTGASVLLQQERGKLKVGDLAAKYLADLPETWQKITIHQLLTHTSGIPNYVGVPPTDQYFRTGAKPREILAMVSGKPLEFASGTQVRYTNTGYVLLGMILEQTSGIGYEEFLTNNIFQPLHMDNSGYDHAATILSERASGYMKKDGKLVNADFVDMSFPYAAGGIYSTVGDMYVWNEALTEAGKLLTKESLRQMFAVYPEATGYGNQSYGYGVVITHRFGRLLHYHGGGVQGFESSIQRYPKERLCIVLLENLDPSKPWDSSDHVASNLFHEPMPTAPEYK